MKVLNEINKNNDIIIESANKNGDFFSKKYQHAYYNRHKN